MRTINIFGVSEEHNYEQHTMLKLNQCDIVIYFFTPHPSNARIFTRATTWPGLGFFDRELPITRIEQSNKISSIYFSNHNTLSW